MGIIRAVTGAVGGALADQWLEVIEPGAMSDTTVFVGGVPVRKNDRRGSNRKGTVNTVSNGSVIHVYPNQFMMLVDGGKVVDYSAEEGYFIVNNASMPSLFNGQLDAAVADTFDRVRFGGVSPTAQQVYYINLQEIKGIKFGTRNPVNYFDNMYNAELFLRAHGTYSIKITDPLLFYREVVPRNCETLNINDINTQYLSEFLEAFQSAINQMSADGVRISYVASKGRELGKYMSTILDEEWRQARGMEIQAVGIASITYDEESIKLINMRNQGAMLSDANVREGYMQGAVARGVEAAGSNAGGAMAGFMGVGVGMQTGAVGTFSQANQQQMAGAAPAPAAPGWRCACGVSNAATAKFCCECGQKKPEPATWTCPQCGHQNDARFCPRCGTAKPAGGYKCRQCGFETDKEMKFCPECGDPFEEDEKKS